MFLNLSTRPWQCFFISDSLVTECGNTQSANTVIFYELHAHTPCACSSDVVQASVYTRALGDKKYNYFRFLEGHRVRRLLDLTAIKQLLRTLWIINRAHGISDTRFRAVQSLPALSNDLQLQLFRSSCAFTP